MRTGSGTVTLAQSDFDRLLLINKVSEKLYNNIIPLPALQRALVLCTVSCCYDRQPPSSYVLLSHKAFLEKHYFAYLHTL